MLFKTENNHSKYLSSLFFVGFLYSSAAFAQELNCEHANQHHLKTVCSKQFTQERQQLNTSALTAYLITDAPLRLVQDTNQIWQNRLAQCKSYKCYKQQFEDRIEQLNFFTSINQSLTQHYLKYENGKLASTPVHLKIHQLNKDNIKVEGIAYRNPNNKVEKQTIPFLAYSTTETKTDISNNESDCKYTFHYNKGYLKITTQQKNCDSFVGVYRVYN